VSVIRRNPDGSWHGDMLDGLAFVKAQQDHGARIAAAQAAGGKTADGGHMVEAVQDLMADFMLGG